MNTGITTPPTSSFRIVEASYHVTVYISLESGKYLVGKEALHLYFLCKVYIYLVQIIQFNNILSCYVTPYKKLQGQNMGDGWWETLILKQTFH